MVKMKKISIIILLFLLFINIFCTEKIIALDVNSETTGYSYGTIWPQCYGPIYAGCGDWSEDFIIRATLVTKNKQMVPGTKTVEFFSNNPAKNDNKYNIYSSYTDSEIKKNFNYTTPEQATLTNDDQEKSYLFLGSSIANNSNRNDMSELVYQINMGFGSGTAVEESFKNYKNLRADFMRYATNLKERKIYVSEIGKNVSFVDFFLKVSGFTSKWKLEDDDRLEDIKNGDYYIIIEPVYSYTVWTKYGTKYKARGTSKQLAQMIYSNFLGPNKNVINMNETPWYWVPFEEKIAYNHYCNFVELGTGLFDSVKSNYCSSLDNFKFYAQTNKPGTYKPKTSSNSIFGDFTNTLSELISQLKIFLYRTQNIFKDMSDKNTNIGVNVIDLSHGVSLPTSIKKVENNCEIKTYDCTNNDFKFSTTLVSKDIAACVFPKYNGALEQALENIFFTYGQGTQKMYCYDDVTYDFSDLKNYFERNKETKLNQLFEIPSGKLTVKRTCYSKTDASSIYNNVFQSEPVNINNLYEKNFKLNFNGKEYTYELNNTKYQMIGNIKKTSNFEVNTSQEKGDNLSKEYYKYTSTFNYDYVLNEGTENKNASISINELTINNFNNNNKTINLGTYDNSKIIKNPSNENWKTYQNTLTPKTTTKFGLSTKLFFMLPYFSQNGKIEGSSSGSPKIMETLNYSTSINTENNTCDFTTYTNNTTSLFRVISLSNPFPARDGSSRMPGLNWINKSENNVYTYIQNNRNVTEEEVYNKKPLYTITLTPSKISEIREYNKTTAYNSPDITCETGTGRMCIDNYIRKYTTDGTCKNITANEITNFNKKVKAFIESGCNETSECLQKRNTEVVELDINKDGKITELDYKEADYYTCADKDYTSGG